MTHSVVTTAITKYSTELDHYKSEAGKFGNLVSQADVGDKSWGLIGLVAKQTYTSKLDELKQLLDAMKNGLEGLQGKLDKAAEIYDGHEKDTVMTFGKFNAKIDGPL